MTVIHVHKHRAAMNHGATPTSDINKKANQNTKIQRNPNFLEDFTKWSATSSMCFRFRKRKESRPARSRGAVMSHGATPTSERKKKADQKQKSNESPKFLEDFMKWSVSASTCFFFKKQKESGTCKILPALCIHKGFVQKRRNPT